MRTALILALLASGCSPVRVQVPQPPARPAPAMVSIEASSLATAADEALSAIEAEVENGTLTKAAAAVQAKAIRDMAAELRRLDEDVTDWAETADPVARAQQRGDAIERIHLVGRVLGTFDRPPWWGPVIDAYLSLLLTAGGVK